MDFVPDQGRHPKAYPKVGEGCEGPENDPVDHFHRTAGRQAPEDEEMTQKTPTDVHGLGENQYKLPFGLFSFAAAQSPGEPPLIDAGRTAFMQNSVTINHESGTMTS